MRIGTGRSPPGAPEIRALRGIARTFQTPRIIGEASVLQNVMIGGTVNGRATFVESLLALPRHRRDEESLAADGLAALRAVGLERSRTVRADRLQHSELRFMEIARALMLRPAFLLLDEPAAGLAADEITRLGRVGQGNQPARHGRAAGRAPCRPDLRDLRSRHGAEPGPVLASRNTRADPRPQGGGQCLSRCLIRCCDVQGLHAGYGKSCVLHGIDLSVGAGEVVALLGPNGAGKTTLLRAVSGLLPWHAGGVRFDGADLTGIGPRATAHAGLAHVVEGHRIFTQQSVTDNLLLAGYDLPRGERPARIEEALVHFPEIAAKRHERGSALSGGPAADARGGAGPGAPTRGC